MPISSANVPDLAKTADALVERTLKRPKANESKIRSPLYWEGLVEQGWFASEPLARSVVSLYDTFNAVSIVDAVALMAGGVYSEEAHMLVATAFAELYFAHILSPVAINKGKQVVRSMPTPSLFFTLAVGGLPIIKAMAEVSPSAEKWSPRRIARTNFNGIHEAIVADLLTLAFYEARALPQLGMQATLYSEYDVVLPVTKASGKEYVLRPDAIVVYEAEDTPVDVELQNPVYVFLEYDNGTEPLATVRGKIVHYALAVEQKKVPPSADYVLAFVFNKPKRASAFIREIARLPDRYLELLARVPIWITSLQEVEQAGGFLRANWVGVSPADLHRWKALAKQLSQAPVDTHPTIREAMKKVQWHSRSIAPLDDFRAYLVGADFWKNPYEDIAREMGRYYEIEFSVFQDVHKRLFDKLMCEKPEKIRRSIHAAVSLLERLTPHTAR